MPKREVKINDAHIYDVIVVGGGPAGMMAAGIAAARGKSVLLLEKNKRLGEKLRITGGGRCNITNYELDVRKLLKHYGKAEPFLYSSFAEFGIKETELFFKKIGIRFKVEANNRAFPHTEHAPDVAQALEKFCRDNQVVIKTGVLVKQVMATDSITGIETNHGMYSATSYIIATGGLSHPETGSTGDGIRWMYALHHQTVAATPTLVPIAIKDTWPRLVSGVTLPGIKITWNVDGVKKFSQQGNVLCTHFGFSGPLILNSSKQVADALHEGEVTGTIDLFPKKDIGILDRELVVFLNEYKNKQFKNAIKEFVPAGVFPGLQNLIEKSPMRAILDEKVHSVSKDARKDMVRLLKNIPFTVKGLMGFDRAIVADGGVLLSEIDTKTFRSKKYPNLFIVGDVLNVNRPSGGYSLQLCWTTGYVAGMSA